MQVNIVQHNLHFVILLKNKASEISDENILFALDTSNVFLVFRPTAVRAISTDIICQTIVQHCRTSDFELTVTCCVKLRLSLYLQIQT